MATNFPTSLDALTNPTSSDSLSSPSHSAQHANVNDAVEALQAKVGVDGSAVTTSLDYKVAQQGLVLVKTQTVGTSVSSVTVTDAFSSTFVNYKVIYFGGTTAASTDFYFQLSGLTTGYYGTQFYDNFLGTVFGANRFNNTTTWQRVGGGSTASSHIDINVYGPNLASETLMTFSGYSQSQYMVSGGGKQTSATAATGFVIGSQDGPALTGGTIRVYGYNNG